MCVCLFVCVYVCECECVSVCLCVCLLAAFLSTNTKLQACLAGQTHTLMELGVLNELTHDHHHQPPPSRALSAVYSPIQGQASRGWGGGAGPHC